MCVTVRLNVKHDKGWCKGIKILTISPISGSSGFGSAIKDWIDFKTVETFQDGFQAPCINLLFCFEVNMLENMLNPNTWIPWEAFLTHPGKYDQNYQYLDDKWEW